MAGDAQHPKRKMLSCRPVLLGWDDGVKELQRRSKGEKGMKNWHPLRLAALLLCSIGSLLCLSNMYSEIKAYLVLHDLAILTGETPPSPMILLILCLLPAGLGLASVLCSLRDAGGSRKLAMIMAFIAAGITGIVCLLSHKVLPDIAFLLFLVAGVLLIVWPQVAMPPVDQFLNRTPAPGAFVASACSTPPHTAAGPAPASGPQAPAGTGAGQTEASPTTQTCATPSYMAAGPASDGLPTIICPGCRNTVSALARRCPYCGHPFRDMRASQHSRLVALLLCFFLGCLGIHRFYVGKFGTGILQLLTLGGLFIWSFIDFIFIACGIFRDAEGKPLTEWDAR